MIKTTALTLLVVAILATPFLAASAPGLVTCGLYEDDISTPTVNEKDPCSLCHLFVLGKGITDFLTGTIAPALAVLAFALAGFKILISGGSPGRRQEGINIIRNTIIGLLIVFGAWIVIDELLIFFVGSKNVSKVTIGGVAVPWSEIICEPPAVAAIGVKGPAYDAIDESPPKGDERRQLAAAPYNITAKTNYCDDFNKPYLAGEKCCTTLAKLPATAINGLKALKLATHADIHITGGTETICHSSHGPGKSIVDVALNNTLNGWIQQGSAGIDATYLGFPAGSRLYTSSNPTFAGVQFIHEFVGGVPTHWHIIFP